MITLKEIVKNAVETAMRDGYNQIVYTDEEGEYSFSRDYPNNNMYRKENVIGKVITIWNNKGILTAEYIKY